MRITPHTRLWATIIMGVALIVTAIFLGSCLPTWRTPQLTRDATTLEEASPQLTAAVTSSGTQATSPAMAPQSEANSAGSVSGYVMSKSDVATIPDSPLETLVFVIHSASFDLLLEEAGAARPTEGDYGKLGLSFPPDLLDKYVVASAISRPDGQYGLQVPVGTYLLCVADPSSAMQTTIQSIYVLGCVKVAVSSDMSVTQKLYVQFGWVTSE